MKIKEWKFLIADYGMLDKENDNIDVCNGVQREQYKN